MNEVEIFDDIDADYEPLKYAEEDLVSKFCIAIYDATNNVYIGSGVLLNSEGLFMSAGHNFKKSNVQFGAYFDGKCYDVSLSFHEYDREELLDFAVGKLLNFDSHDYLADNFPKLRTCSDLKVGSAIKIAGFKSSIVIQAEVISELNPTDKIRIFKQRKEFSLIYPDRFQQILSEQLEGRGAFYMRTQDAECHTGFSGGPAYFENVIYGIVVSHYFLKSDYIIQCLKELSTIKRIN